MIPLGILASSAPAGATTYSDDFARADASAPGGDWVAERGTWSIVSNQLDGGSGTEAICRYGLAMPTSDHVAQADLSGTTTEASICTRMNVYSSLTSARFMMARYASGKWQIYAKPGGSYSLVAQTTVAAPSTPYTMRLESIGSAHDLYVNDSLVLSGSYSVGWSGGDYVGFRGYNSTAARWDNWSAWSP